MQSDSELDKTSTGGRHLYRHPLSILARMATSLNPIVYAIPVFMASILVEAAIAAWRRKPVYDIPDALTSLHFGVLSQVTGTLLRLLGFGLYVLVYEEYRATSLPLDAWWVWVGALLAYDFFYYWIHRWGHEVNCLWAAHQVHHSSEYYNLSTALRQTSTGAIAGWPFYLLMAVAGVPPLVFGVVALIDLLYQYWVHTELVPKLGWFDRVFVSPSNHRVHHGQNDYCLDRNYGGILILWDRMFGTFAEERDDEPIVYGVRKPLRSYNAVWGNLHVWTDLFREAGRALRERRLADAVAVFFAPPTGWGVEPGHLDTRQVERFTRHTPPDVRRYTLVQYAVLGLLTTHFLAVAPGLPLAASGLYALVIAAGVLCTGWMLEGRRFARPLETLRLLAVGGAFLWLPDWFGWVASDTTRWAVGALLATSLARLWLPARSRETVSAD